jgi:cob(I)alamin adenosyltransferase
MVKLNKIYTRTGDAGETGLVSGPRRLKSDARIGAYGAVDETNATLGLARLHLAGEPALDACLARAQNDLFDLGADLATPDADMEGALRVTPSQVAKLEADIDAFNAELSPLNSFVLPGGTPAAAYLHLARTICRRAERDVVALSRLAGECVGAPAIQYLNRLSDLLFVAARYVNARGTSDVLWKPGAGR